MSVREANRPYRRSRCYSARLGIRTRRQRRQATRVTAAALVLVCLIAVCSWWSVGDPNRAAVAVARAGNAADAGLTSSQPEAQAYGHTVRQILERLHDYRDTGVVAETWFEPDASILPGPGDEQPVPTLPWPEDEVENPFDVESVPTAVDGRPGGLRRLTPPALSTRAVALLRRPAFVPPSHTVRQRLP